MKDNNINNVTNNNNVSADPHQSQTQKSVIHDKEQLRIKKLLQGGYDQIHKESGKMIKKKQYQKAFTLL
jgi:hypothetical protein